MPGLAQSIHVWVVGEPLFSILLYLRVSQGSSVPPTPCLSSTTSFISGPGASACVCLGAGHWPPPSAVCFTVQAARAQRAP